MALLTLPLSELRQRTSMKWREYPKDVLPMWVAEMDTPLAAPVREALGAALARGDTGYGAGDDYAHALAEFASNRWGWSFEPGRAGVVPDVASGLFELFKVLTAPGDAIVLNSPVYPPFYRYINNIERRVVEAPLNSEGRLDFDNLERAFKDAKAYLLCSPHNPTGVVHTLEELALAARLANESGVRVVADEIHAPLVLPGNTFTPYLTVPGAETGFSVISASKGWNLAGLKAALAIAGEEARKDLERLPADLRHGASHLGLIAHVAALREGGPWLDQLLAELDANRHLLRDQLADRLPGIGYGLPQATYLSWLDCRGLGLGDDPAAVFLERGRVAFSAGAEFGTGGAGHVRFNIATSPELIVEGVNRMAAALAASHASNA